MQTIALNEEYDFRWPVLDDAMREKMRASAAVKGAK
jgi:hypothetical protein